MVMAKSTSRTDSSSELRDTHQQTTDDLSWLRAFQEWHGRPLRVLHVGNIAGNAYLNAKFLRSVGVEADVVSPNYTHVMGRPEWEDVELLHGHGDDFAPAFDDRDLAGYKPPEWYASGSLVSCVAQIVTRFKRSGRARGFAATLKWLERALPGPLALHAFTLILTSPLALLRKVLEKIAAASRRLPRIVKTVGRPPYRILWSIVAAQTASERTRNSSLVAKFAELFPDRPDKLTHGDVHYFSWSRKRYRELFSHYDVVQCYATQPIAALLAGKKPYVSFEHGTLRHFTLGEEPLHRLTALAYRMSDHTFITNGDCLAYAKRLGLESYSPIIHPIDVDQHRKDYGTAIDDIRREIGGDVILFCPTRHDWDIKGTQQFIRALPFIKRRVPGRIRLLLVDWGLQVDESKKLLDELGCADDVVWKTTMCRITMIKHIRAADAIFDQMVLPVLALRHHRPFLRARRSSAAMSQRRRAGSFPSPPRSYPPSLRRRWPKQ